MPHACADDAADRPPTDPDRPAVLLRPDPPAWEARRGAPDEQAARFRRELGLPTDRPVVMSGHQAQVWHPGILAKLLAMRAYARRTSACAAWIVVDHDDHDPLTVRAPMVGPDGRLAVATLGPPAGAEGVPACRRPPWRPGDSWQAPDGLRPAAPGVARGLERIRAAFATHAAAASAGAQAASAAWQLLPGDTADGVALIYASSLARTALFAELVDRMMRDPAACIDAHNAAVRRFPRDRVAPLAEGELPLWAIGEATGSPRRRVFANDPSPAARTTLAPRALLLTGLLRMAGCDLFIHGLGGERYDRITERWLGAWLGRELAPATVATATVRLRIPGSWPTPDDIARAAWRAHRARHDPAALGDEPRAARRRELLARINTLPPRSPERAAAFNQLHDLLHESQRANAARLAELDARAAALRARAAEAAIAADRTWPFPLYEPDQLAALRREIESRFA